MCLEQTSGGLGDIYPYFNQVLRTDLFSLKSFNRMGFVVFTPIVGRLNSSLDIVLG